MWAMPSDRPGLTAVVPKAWLSAEAAVWVSSTLVPSRWTVPFGVLTCSFDPSREANGTPGFPPMVAYSIELPGSTTKFDAVTTVEPLVRVSPDPSCWMEPTTYPGLKPLSEWISA